MTADEAIAELASLRAAQVEAEARRREERRVVELAVLLFPHIEVTTIGIAVSEAVAERRAVQAVRVARAMLAAARERP